VIDFVGAKLLLVQGTRLLTYLRDDKPGLPWRAMWDLPGGGREGNETPETCALRELDEEFGLQFPPERLVWRRIWPSMIDAERQSIFFAGRIALAEISTIRFGDEGQYWRMMEVAEFLAHEHAIPEMQRRVGVALGELGWGR
jgi:8-oxo-dGTP diphosphatase